MRQTQTPPNRSSTNAVRVGQMARALWPQIARNRTRLGPSFASGDRVPKAPSDASTVSLGYGPSVTQVWVIFISRIERPKPPAVRLVILPSAENSRSTLIKLGEAGFIKWPCAIFTRKALRPRISCR